MVRPDFDWRGLGPERAANYLFGPIVSELRRCVAKRILDVGSGDGTLAGRLVAAGFEVVGIEPSASGVAMARANNPAVRFENDVAEADLLRRLGSPPFDAVLATEVIEHVYSPPEFLQACAGCLRQDGLLVLTCPFHGYWKNLALALTGRMDRHFDVMAVGGHIKFWSPRTLGLTLTQAGFREIKWRGIGRAPLIWEGMLVTARWRAKSG